MRLGRLAHNPVALSRAPRLSARMPPQRPPPSLGRGHLDYRPQMLGNDVNPTCSVVALVNSALGFAACNGDTFSTSDAPVDAAYCAVTGTPLDQIATSDGAGLLDVMRYQCSTGIPIEPQLTLTGAFGTIEPTDRRMLALACAMIGPVILGLDLTMAQQTQDVWDVGGDTTEWGGHGVAMWSYTGLDDNDTVRVATWGGLKRATWRWLGFQLREAYGVCWPTLMPPSGRQWAGLDIDGLREDVEVWCDEN